jgi:cell division protein FtsL
MMAWVTTYWLEIALAWLGLSCLIGIVWSAISVSVTIHRARQDSARRDE